METIANKTHPTCEASGPRVLGYRMLDSGSWVRDEEGHTSGGYPSVIHVAGPKDATRTIGYREQNSHACGWCYLNASHSLDEHARKMNGRG